jgi:GntR family transcriptional regulator
LLDNFPELGYTKLIRSTGRPYQSSGPPSSEREEVIAEQKPSGKPPFSFGDSLSMRKGIVPLYHSIGHLIRIKIDSGDWQIDQQIPSERELVASLRVSRATVRLGIENLVKEGILYRVRGKGTFVAPPKVSQGVLRLFDFFDTMRRNGLVPSARLLNKARLVPPLNECAHLGIGNGQEAVWFQRLLLVDDVPVLIESSYFAVERFATMLDTYDGMQDVHTFLAERYGVQITREREVFEPVILETNEAEQLGVKGGFPALWIEHTAYDRTGSPVAFLTSLMRGDRCRLYTDLTLGSRTAASSETEYVRDAPGAT